MTHDNTDAVTLNWVEAAFAAQVGCWRHIAALKAGKQDCHGYEGLGWSEHIEGACGEVAVAKILGRYWDGSVNTWKADDLPGLQIRTRSKPHYELIVRPGDGDEATFVHVTGRCPTYSVRGWIIGGEAKRPEWLQNYGGRPAAYFVPTAMLNDIEHLRNTAALR